MREMNYLRIGSEQFEIADRVARENTNTFINTITNDTDLFNQFESAKITNYGLTNVYQQDADIYGGDVFEFRPNDLNVSIYNFSTKTLKGTASLVGGYKPHSNVACFGKKAHRDYKYPVIYLTGYNGLDNNNNNLPYGTCFVYQFSSTFSNELVQQIKINFINDELWMGTGTADGVAHYGNFVVDADNDRLFVYKTGVWAGKAKTRVFVFNLPSVDVNNRQSVVTLNLTDIVDRFDLPFYPYPQGAKYYKGKLYISAGASVTSYLNVVDVETKQQEQSIYLGNNMAEPEAVIFNNDKLYVAQGTFLEVELPRMSNVGQLSALNTINNWNIVEALNELNSKVPKFEKLPLTYIQNDYVNTTDFSRITAWRYGQLAVINCDLRMSANFPWSSQFISIGTLNKSLKQGATIDVMGTSAGVNSHITISMNASNGNIQIFNYSSTTAPIYAFYRGVIVCVLND